MPLTVQIPGLTGAEAEVGSSLFDYVQFLLDDDAHMTPAGNLNGLGRERLRARLNELLDGPAEPEGVEPDPADPTVAVVP